MPHGMASLIKLYNNIQQLSCFCRFDKIPIFRYFGWKNLTLPTENIHDDWVYWPW
jgi:hypothetical protein